MREVSILLLMSLLCSGCGVTRLSGVKSGGRFRIGEEERYEVRCMEGGVEEVYEWVRVGRDSLAYDGEKRVWDFVGKRKRDDRVLRVINNSCSMVMEVLI